MQPLSDRMITDIEEKNMAKESPILVRIFKQESELEVWKEDKNGRSVAGRVTLVPRSSKGTARRRRDSIRSLPA